MKKILTALILAGLLLAPGAGFAGERDPLMGEVPAPPGMVTVMDAEKLADGTPVTMEGRIEQSLGGEFHRFSDLSGTTTISIKYADEDALSAIDLNDIVVIKGHVKHRFDVVDDLEDPFYVEVDEFHKR